MAISTMPAAIARATMLSAKGPSNMRGKRVRMSMRTGGALVEEAGRERDGHRTGIEVDGADHVLEGGNEDLTARPPDDVDVITPRFEHVGDRAKRFAFSRKDVQVDDLVDEVFALGQFDGFGFRD